MSAQPSRIQEIYHILLDFYGPQHWWPAESVFEVIVGAVLTQNTNWQNVKKSLNELERNGLLNFEALDQMEEPELAQFIRSSGYFNLKAKRLKNLLRMIRERCDGNIQLLFEEDLMSAREALLSVKGIGAETADSILLYGGNKPIFVVDTYTHRIFSRHHMVPEECDYQSLQDLFMENLDPDPSLFNEYHALIVKTGHLYCKKSKPLCDSCPLKEV